MLNSRAEIVGRIANEIEQLVTQFYPGQGMLGPRMFIELPKGMQWELLNRHVNWNGLAAKEKDEVLARVLKDVREKVPEEIYPATWFDGILISVDRDTKVFDLGEVRRQIETPARDKNLDERICSKDHGIER